MARKNANTAAKPKVRSRPVKPKKSKTDRPGGKRPKTPADEPPEEAVVSRMTMIRHSGRGGRGR